MIIQCHPYTPTMDGSAPVEPADGQRTLNDRPRIPANWQGAGRFTGAPTEDRSKRASVRRRLRDLLDEETTDEDGETLTWSDRIARGLVRRAATGNVPAVQLVIDQVDGPIPRVESDGHWQVTINYVHQQLNVSADPALEAPDTER
jgi:hypothetical protein